MSVDDLDDFMAGIQIEDEELQELATTEVVPFDGNPATDAGNNELIPADEKELVVSNQAEDLERDYQYARENLRNVIQTGNQVLKDMVDFAKQTTSPRAYEVLGQMLRAQMDSNEKLLDIHNKMKKIRDGEAAPVSGNSQSAGTINNIVFNGTTEELFDLIQDREDIIDAESRPVDGDTLPAGDETLPKQQKP